MDDVYYKAMLARDRRFDGKFFIGVKTTGIYCRPICPAKPKRKNVEFFRSALEAEKAGYRPCLRCRPEFMPLSPAWYGSSALVSRAMKIILAKECGEFSESSFANRLGVSSRHLRRLFQVEIGQTPKQLFDNHRLNFARKLVAETQLPVTDIAMSSGFQSLRRFNSAFKSRFHQAPTALRKTKSLHRDETGVELSLSYRPPLDWKSLLDFYASHQVVGVDQVTGNTYQRLFQIDQSIGAFSITHDSRLEALKLCIHSQDPKIYFKVVQRVRNMFDLDADPIAVANAFEHVSLLKKLWRKNPGLRLTGGWDPFETAVCTILGQLVSSSQARSLISQLVSNYGRPVENLAHGGIKYIFPTPEDLVDASLEKVRTTAARRQSIRELAKRVLNRSLDLYTPQDSEMVKALLLDIPGIGPWSAQYIALRALGDTDAFPKSDLILKRVLQAHPDIDLETIRPWRAYAAIHLWKAFASSMSKTKRKVAA